MLPPRAPARAPSTENDSTTDGICAIDPTACPSQSESARFTGHGDGAEVYAVHQTGATSGLRRTMSKVLAAAPGTTTSSPASTATLPSAGQTAQPHEMLDIEARFAVECESVTTSAEKLRARVRAAGGTVTLDQSELRGRTPEATFELRVPIPAYDPIVVALESVGTVRTREVKVKDIAKEHHDAELLLSNLEAALHRYEELLAKAATVPEVLAVERELERLRARIDRVKGDLAWMKDRVARATVRVRLFATATSEEAPLETRSGLYPSLRAVALIDLRGESDRFGYAGGGVGVAWHPPGGTLRALGVELDIARSAFTDRPPGSDYAYLALAALDVYSDLLGGGRRRFLNPFLGLRSGYAQSGGKGDLVVGGALGVDLWKAKNASLGLVVRGLAMIGNDRGAHLMVGPELTFGFAF